MNTNTKAMLIALSPLLGFLIGGFFFVPPIILWAIWKDQDPAVDALGKRVVNAQISWFLWFLAAGILCFVLIGIILLPILSLVWLILTIVKAIACNNGDMSYKFPLTINFIS